MQTDLAPILQKLQADATAFSADTLRQAKERAEQLRQDAHERQEAQRQEAADRLAQDSAEALQRIQRMGELEAGKLVLADRRQRLAAAFDAAHEALLALDDAKKRALFLQLVLDSAQGGEGLVIGAVKPAWAKGFCQDVNAALEKAGRPAGLYEAATPGAGCGPTLVGDGVEVALTLEALLQNKRLSLEAEVARILFAADQPKED